MTHTACAQFRELAMYGDHIGRGVCAALDRIDAAVPERPRISCGHAETLQREREHVRRRRFAVGTGDACNTDCLRGPIEEAIGNLTENVLEILDRDDLQIRREQRQRSVVGGLPQKDFRARCSSLCGKSHAVRTQSRQRHECTACDDSAAIQREIGDLDVGNVGTDESCEQRAQILRRPCACGGIHGHGL